jgi:hypothetical protein
MLLAGAGTPANHANIANPIQRPWPSTRYPYDSACRPITRGFHHEGTKFTKKKDRVRWGIWGANFDEEWGHARDWGRLKVCRGRGFLAKTQRREVWLARVGLPVNHANVANPPCDKAIPPPRLHISVALLSTFDFLPTNPG